MSIGVDQRRKIVYLSMYLHITTTVALIMYGREYEQRVEDVEWSKNKLKPYL